MSGSVGFVPTMGALHDGHLSLIEKSNDLCNNTIVSVFINPKQFGENEDLIAYPKSLKKDLEKLGQYSVDAIFCPGRAEIYSSNSTVFVDESELTQCLEGQRRPAFFQGVLTVVCKLFNIIEPTHSFFGEKDPQQLRLIKKMCADLNFNIKIISCPTIREKNGLAMGSRNEFLSQYERSHAGIINEALVLCHSALCKGEKSVENIKAIIKEKIESEPLATIDFISVADEKTLLEQKNTINDNTIISVAVFFGSTRLIDNFTYLTTACL